MPSDQDPTFRLKRVYDPVEPTDGTRVLVDRLWPRGVGREGAPWDVWARELAPSDALRREFHREPERWSEFRERYWTELAAHPDRLDPIRTALAAGPVTLLYAARNRERNNAVALKTYLQSALGGGGREPGPAREVNPRR